MPDVAPSFAHIVYELRKGKQWEFSPFLALRSSDVISERSSADVAQLVEHVLGKDEVSGSIPDVGSESFSCGALQIFFAVFAHFFDEGVEGEAFFGEGVGGVAGFGFVVLDEGLCGQEFEFVGEGAGAYTGEGSFEFAEAARLF